MRNKEAKDIAVHYRHVFNDEIGLKVFTHMLGELGFFNEIVTDDHDTMLKEVTLHNYAIKLMSRCGFWNEENIEEVIQEAKTSPSRGGLVWNWFNRIIPSIFKEG